jgi:hypothetical protein
MAGAHTTTVRPAAMSMGAKGSTILLYVRRIERDADAQAKHLRENAQVIYLGIKKTSRIPKGIDKIPAARRQRRQMLKMAAAAEAQANAARVFRYKWIQTFGRPGSAESVKKGGIDTTQ